MFVNGVCFNPFLPGVVFGWFFWFSVISLLFDCCSHFKAQLLTHILFNTCAWCIKHKEWTRSSFLVTTQKFFIDNSKNFDFFIKKHLGSNPNFIIQRLILSTILSTIIYFSLHVHFLYIGDQELVLASLSSSQGSRLMNRTNRLVLLPNFCLFTFR